MAVTEGPWLIGQPGGPSGPFYSLVNPQGRVVAMQIPNRDDAECMADASATDMVSAYFAIRVLRDALMAYMEPAGDTPEELRKQARFALRFAQKALPLERDQPARESD